MSDNPMVPWKLGDGRTIALLTPKELKALPDGTSVVCIDGSVVVKGKNTIDDDTRGGRLAYGLVVGETVPTYAKCAALERELAEAKDDLKWANVKLVATSETADAAHTGREQAEAALAAAHAEVEAAARWCWDAGKDAGGDIYRTGDCETWAETWSRYQQERQ